MCFQGAQKNAAHTQSRTSLTEPYTELTRALARRITGAWSLQLNWNTAALELASFSSSNLYATPTTNQNNAAGTLTVAVVGVQSGTALSDVTGTAVLLLTATFRVRSGAAESHNCTNAVALTALEFLNQGSYRFVENGAAQIDDARGMLYQARRRPPRAAV